MNTIANSLEAEKEWIVIRLNPDRDLLQSMGAKLCSTRSNAELFQNAKLNLSLFGFGITVDEAPPITDIEFAIDLCHIHTGIGETDPALVGFGLAGHLNGDLDLGGQGLGGVVLADSLIEAQHPLLDQVLVVRAHQEEGAGPGPDQGLVPVVQLPLRLLVPLPEDPLDLALDARSGGQQGIDAVAEINTVGYLTLKEAFEAYVSCLHQLYLFGAAMQLKRMGYHTTKMQ